MERDEERVSLPPGDETPEDVAVLYSWANVSAGKYRDFSASRREYRAELRRQQAEQQRIQELYAQQVAEAAAAEAAKAAAEAEYFARLQQEEDARQAALRDAAEAARYAEAERAEAERRAEAAARAEAERLRAEREIAVAHASAERQAARYYEAEQRQRTKANAVPVPGQIADPYTRSQGAGERDAETAAYRFRETRAAVEQLREDHRLEVRPSATFRPTQETARAHREPAREPFREPPQENQVDTSDRSRLLTPDPRAGARIEGTPVRPDETSAASPSASRVPDRSQRQAEADRFREREAQLRTMEEQEEALRMQEEQDSREQAARREREQAEERLREREEALRQRTRERELRQERERLAQVQLAAAAAAAAARENRPSPYVAPAAETLQTPRREERPAEVHEPLSEELTESRFIESYGRRRKDAESSIVRAAPRPREPRLRTGYEPSLRDSEVRDEQAAPAWIQDAPTEVHRVREAAVDAPSPVVDTLQHSRERVASRWFALKGLFEEGNEPPEVPVLRAKEENRIPTLAVFSLAGGVGKTSLVATLGRTLSSLGEKVLLADTASHGLLPYYFGARELRPGVVRTFTPPVGSSDAPIYLVSYELEYRSHEEDALTPLETEMRYPSNRTHRVVIDLSAASGWALSRLARLNPMILIPLAPDMNSIISLQAVERFLASTVNAEGRPLVPYYVINQFDSSLPLHLDVREVLRQKIGDRLLPCTIRRSPSVSEALAEGMTVLDYAPDAGITDDYMNVANWLRSVAAPAASSLRNLRWSER